MPEDQQPNPFASIARDFLHQAPQWVQAGLLVAAVAFVFFLALAWVLLPLTLLGVRRDLGRIEHVIRAQVELARRSAEAMVRNR